MFAGCLLSTTLFPEDFAWTSSRISLPHDRSQGGTNRFEGMSVGQQRSDGTRRAFIGTSVGKYRCVPPACLGKQARIFHLRHFAAFDRIWNTCIPLLSRPPPDVCFVRVVCARSIEERILLSGSRFTAGLVYPGLAISIFSKCYATRSFLHHSWYGAVINCELTHEMHACE